MNTENQGYTCLVCGWNKLEDEPYPADGTASFVCCESCGFEYGYDDIPSASGVDESLTKEQVISNYRSTWIAGGMQWWNMDAREGEQQRPTDWNPKAQLLNIGIKLED